MMHTALAGRRFFSSWSGGKDAYLAHGRAVAQGGVPAALLCMLHEGGRVSRGHGLPLVTRATSWDDYESTFVSALHELRERGVQAGVFGDIEAVGGDACGEEGEYHTIVTDGPGFAAPVEFAWTGVVARDGHWVLGYSQRATVKGETQL